MSHITAHERHDCAHRPDWRHVGCHSPGGRRSPQHPDRTEGGAAGRHDGAVELAKDDSTRLRVMVDDSADFASPVARQTTTNTTSSLRSSSGAGTLYWRVRAFNAASESSDWLFSEFNQGRVGKPRTRGAGRNQAQLAARGIPVLRCGRLPWGDRLLGRDLAGELVHSCQHADLHDSVDFSRPRDPP